MSFDDVQNILFAISPVMSESSQNDSAMQAQKHPAIFRGKLRKVSCLKLPDFPLFSARRVV